MGEHSWESRVQARKVHRCELCRDPIRLGTVHVLSKSVGDDTWFSVRLHTYCDDWAEAVALFCYRNRYEIPYYDCMVDFIRDVFGDGNGSYERLNGPSLREGG